MKLIVKVQALSVTTEVNGKVVSDFRLTEPVTRVIYTPPRRIRLSQLPTSIVPIRVSLKQTAALIRADLRREFRLTKFSVRTRGMSGGTSAILIRWQSDRATFEEVNAVVDKYAGAISDESGDFMDDVATEIEGHWYQFEVTFISCQRDTHVIEGKLSKKSKDAP